MHEIAKAEGKISGRTSFDAAKQGDKAAQAVVKQYAQYVADGIVSVENVLQPDIISVGGGISREGEYLLQLYANMQQQTASINLCLKQKL